MKSIAWNDWGLLVLRLGAGGMMMTHGWPKLMSYHEKKDTFMDFMGLGPELSLALTILAEFFCALLVVAGIGTRMAAFPVAFAMGVAAFVAHKGDSFGDKEFALLYGFAFLALTLTGGGKYTLLKLIGRG